MTKWVVNSIHAYEKKKKEKYEIFPQGNSPSNMWAFEYEPLFPNFTESMFSDIYDKIF